MSQYSPLPRTSPFKLGPDEEDLESLQEIPSNLDIALNGGNNQSYLSPNTAAKSADASLLDPEAFSGLSISTASSIVHSRGNSPFPNPSHPIKKGWKGSLQDFWEIYQGLILVAFSQLFGALMNVTTRLLELEGEGMQPFQILFVRMLCTLVFCCAWMWWTKVPDFPWGAKGVRRLLVARGCTGFFGIYGMYYSLQYLPVADAVVITFLAPAVASYACYLVLHEPFPRSAQYASLISLFGVVLIARPTSFFSSSDSSANIPVHPSSNTTITTTTNTHHFPIPTSTQRLSAILVALLGVLGSAGAFTTIRLLGPRVHPLLSVNYFALICTITSILALSLSRPLHISSTLHFALPSSLRQWGMLSFLGICGFVMQFLLTKGLATGGRKEGAAATNMIYTNMLFALALDRVVFGVSPGWWSLGGSGLILGSAVWVAVTKGKDSGDSTTRADDEERAGGGMRSGGMREQGVEEEEMHFLDHGQGASRRQG